MSSSPSGVQPAAKKPRIPEIDILRTMAILAVIMIHATGFMLSKLDKASSYYLPYSALQNLSAFAVPVFIFISGFVLFYSYLEKPITSRLLGTFYRKRMLTAVVPYIAFSVIYYLVRHRNDPDLLTLPNLKHFGYLLLTGQAYTHLYYMIVIIQFYLLFPLLLYAMQKIKRPLIILLAGVLVQWAYYFVNREVIVKLTNIPEVLHQTGDFFTSYIAYFMFGAYLAAHGERFMAFARFQKPGQSAWGRSIPWIFIFAVWLGAGLYYAYINYMGAAHKIWATSQTFQSVWFVYNLASGLVLFRLAIWVYKALGSGWRQAVLLIGQCSFGIYLLHPLVLMYYRKLPVSGNPLLFHLYFIGEYASALLLSWAITYFLMRRFRWSWVLFGSSLAKRQIGNGSGSGQPG
ncbi:acyltransferase [Cohnella lubricantis]|uniref:Acyltransferase n=1 Tax=Cohnella lubricantis TaxID=2163172 RepID=A0A841TG22_9BACL|nr:acyltransferase [Cohnella lubricantis]MBB6678180.1 acyltransferase [Cohnella lubricantis]MBP2119694.1 peptidoglycan/LPS O-acetylase OafA/YrhL [Cohnella lubricantis]